MVKPKSLSVFTTLSDCLFTMLPIKYGSLVCTKMALASKEKPIQLSCARFTDSGTWPIGISNGRELNAALFKVSKTIVSFFSLQLQKQTETSRKVNAFFINGRLI